MAFSFQLGLNYVTLAGKIENIQTGENYVRFTLIESYQAKDDVYSRYHNCISFSERVMEAIKNVKNLDEQMVTVIGSLTYGSYNLKDHPEVKVKTASVTVQNIMMFNQEDASKSTNKRSVKKNKNSHDAEGSEDNMPHLD